MDQMQWEKSLRESKYRHQRKNPSFSSSLLDEIYRSIDEGDHHGAREEEMVVYRETMKKKQSKRDDKEETEGYRRDFLIENWMEKKMVSEKVVVRRKSAQDFTTNQKTHQNRSSMIFNSTSSSSDSCCGGGFSSSEAESIYSSSRSSSRPKPIRTSIDLPPKISSSVSPRRSNRCEIHQEEKKNSVAQQKPMNGNGFIKTKSRAMKIYGDLKKVKQPISPGGKLASFLNSLFTAGSPKKPKLSNSLNGGHLDDDHRKSKSGYSTSTTTCSSASSFSRSCLSKTPSSSTRIKRSVRFYPVSVIVDEDCRPCGHKCLYEDHEPGLMAVTTTTSTVSRKMTESPLMMNEELKFHIMEKNRRVEEAARDLLKGYQKKKSDYEMRDVGNVNYHEDEDEEDEDDDDDAASYSSSDLFELDHLATIGGIERYREELPVYETTHFDTNRAIANGLIL